MGNNREENKKKQEFLRLNGVNVKVDGSWGPWQEEQYRKLTTKDKHYQSTPLGALSYLYDKAFGDTTYQEDPDYVKGYLGEIREDTRSDTRRWVDTQMKDNKTPLGYAVQTVAPAAAVAAAGVYGIPYLVNGITKGAPLLWNGVKTAVTNPSTIMPAIKTGANAGLQFAKQAGKGTAKAVAGMEAFNGISKATTGKTWGENVAQSTGMSPELAEWTNPGLKWGPKIYNVSKNLYKQGPKYIFDNINYNNYNKLQSLKDDFRILFKTPADQDPLKIIKDRHSVQYYDKPRIDVSLDKSVRYNTFNGSNSNIDDPVAQIRGRLKKRLANNNIDYVYPGYYGYKFEGWNNPDVIMANVPVKEYLPIKEVQRLYYGSEPISFINKLKNLKNYYHLNMDPGYVWENPEGYFIKLNRKAIKDLGLDYSTTLSHEYNHMLRNRVLLDEAQGFDYGHLPKGLRDYLNTTEIEARGTQIKNYFDSDIITPDMLKYASQHYVPDTGVNNNMYQFFSGIRNWDKAAKYLTDHSLKNGGKLSNKYNRFNKCPKNKIF